MLVAHIREEEDVAGHLAPEQRVGEISVDEGPSIRFRRDRHEIRAVEIQELRERRPFDRPVAERDADAAGDDEAVEAQIHLERVAGDAGAVGERHRDVLVADDHEAVGVERHGLRAQFELIARDVRGGRARRAECERGDEGEQGDRHASRVHSAQSLAAAASAAPATWSML